MQEWNRLIRFGILKDMTRLFCTMPCEFAIRWREKGHGFNSRAAKLAKGMFSFVSFSAQPKPSPFTLGLLVVLVAGNLPAGAISPLGSRGYTTLPEVQRFSPGGSDFQFGEGWRLQLGLGVEPNDVAVETLKEDLKARFGVTLSQSGAVGGHAKTLSLSMAPNSIEIGEATDHNRRALAGQAYKIVLAPGNISVKANAAPGLLYGVETLIQLLKPKGGSLWLPAGEITDWPDLELRVIYWDDAHHLEHLDVLKSALRQAAFYKVNGFALKLEGHFQYKSAAPIVEPYALLPAELQELTDYASRYHIDLIPYLDGPAHDAFILKHPEYARLREFPESNYEFCATNPDTYQLLFGMYQDLLDANRGGKYFVLSTDEPYYVGLANKPQCDEATRAKELGSVGKLLAEFVTKTASYLHDRGRTVIFWGEYPLVPEDIPSLPGYLMNGEVYGPKFDPVFRARGIRQMVYTSTEGSEKVFPNYYILPSTRRLHAGLQGPGRVADMVEHISFASTSALSSTQPDVPRARQADLLGAFVAGWADAGLHPETFWLGYASGPAAAWHPASDPEELTSSFYALFYGPSATGMGRLYQLMSEQAQFWDDSWEMAPSGARTPIFGESYGILKPPRPARDHTLPALPVPSAQLLTLGYDWERENAKRLQLAREFLAGNDELIDLLHAELQRAEFNHYNLEVFLSIAQLCRQNLEMLLDLGRINASLQAAQSAAGRGDAERALASVDRALDLVEYVRQRRNAVLRSVTSTWYKSWLPRVAEANGRRYLDRVDDVKDHEPVRTIDMSYLIYRELLLPLGDWAEQARAARNQYAQANHLPTRDGKLDWKDTKTLPATERVGEEED
jgi:hexosaminidase